MDYIIFKCNKGHDQYIDLLRKDPVKDVCCVCGSVLDDKQILKRFSNNKSYWENFHKYDDEFEFGFYRLAKFYEELL